MKKQNIIMLYGILGFVLFCGFLYGLGTYPLLDVDETRYVDMAKNMFHTKDYLTLYLNGDYFFEKPPLFFWIECLSFKLSGIINELSTRRPIVLLSLLPAGFLIFLCRKVKNDKFAIITTMTLFTSLEYMFMTKIAILDSVLTSFVASSVLCYFYTFFVEDKNKKYFWILTYLFSGFAVLAKGVPGVAIPAIIIVISSIIFKVYKETLKYSRGILLFLLITLPWHLIMLKIYPDLFFKEYIYKHLIVLNFILTIATFVMLCVGFFLSYDIYANFKPVQIVSLLVLISFVICNWIFIIKRHKMKLFLSIVIFMTILSGFLTPYIYQFNYTFGENDLIKFAKIARTQGFTILTFKT